MALVHGAVGGLGVPGPDEVVVALSAADHRRFEIQGQAAGAVVVLEHAQGPLTVTGHVFVELEVHDEEASRGRVPADRPSMGFTSGVRVEGRVTGDGHAVPGRGGQLEGEVARPLGAARAFPLHFDVQAHRDEVVAEGCARALEGTEGGLKVHGDACVGLTCVDWSAIHVPDLHVGIGVTVVHGHSRGHARDRRVGISVAVLIRIKGDVLWAGDGRQGRSRVVDDIDGLRTGLRGEVEAVVDGHHRPGTLKAEVALAHELVRTIHVGLLNVHIVVTIVTHDVRRRTGIGRGAVVLAVSVAFDGHRGRAGDAQRRGLVVGQGHELRVLDAVAAIVRNRVSPLVHADRGHAATRHLGVREGDVGVAAVIGSRDEGHLIFQVLGVIVAGDCHAHRSVVQGRSRGVAQPDALHLGGGVAASICEGVLAVIVVASGVVAAQSALARGGGHPGNGDGRGCGAVVRRGSRAVLRIGVVAGAVDGHIVHRALRGGVVDDRDGLRVGSRIQAVVRRLHVRVMVKLP